MHFNAKVGLKSSQQLLGGGVPRAGGGRRVCTAIPVFAPTRKVDEIRAEHALRRVEARTA